MFLVQMFIGMFLGFYCVYPSWRHFINGNIDRGIRYLFRHKKQEILQNPETIKLLNPAYRDVTFTMPQQQTIKKVNRKKLPESKDDDISEDKIAEWLNNNPELRDLNKEIRNL